MKATKKILSLVLALMLVLSSVSALAAVETHECVADTTKLVFTQKPTCEKDGYNEYECTDPTCTKTVEVPIPKLSENGKHDWRLDTENSTEPTCTTAGKNVYYCANKDKGCTETKTEAGAPATGHAKELTGWKYGPNHVEATCQHGGFDDKWKECPDCGARLEVVYGEAKQLTHDLKKFFTWNETTGLPTAVDETYSEANVTATLTPAKCGVDGVAKITCTLCGEQVVATIPALEHKFPSYFDLRDDEPRRDEYDSDDAYEEAMEAYWADKADFDATKWPTCTASGYVSLYCANGCGETSVTKLSAWGHNFDEGEKQYKQDGKIVEEEKLAECKPYTVIITCRECSATKTVDVDATKKHVYSKTPTLIITDPTCEEDGEGLFPCTNANCNDLQYGSIKATGHEIEVARVEKKATCKDDGLKIYTCKECKKETRREVLPALGHGNFIEEKTEPTCTAKGHIKKTCGICGEVVEDKDLPAAHKPGAGAKETPAKCGIPGSRTYTCSVCGAKVENEEIPALEHEWSDTLQVKTPASCEEAEVLAKQCTLCKAFDTKTYAGKPATGHSKPQTVTVLKAATCTEDGEIAYRCENKDCNKYITEPVKATGHKFEVVRYNDETMKMVCSVCGLTKDVESVPATYTIDLGNTSKGNTTSGTGSVKLESGNQVPSELYARVTWVYTLSNGDSFAYCAMKKVEMTDSKNGVFNMVGPQKPFGATLDTVQVALVTDANADASGSYDALATAKK